MPPRPPRPPRRACRETSHGTSRTQAALIGGSLLGAALLAGALVWRDPHVPGSWGLCPWLVSTGTPCATCGGLRAVADLLAGRPGAAFAHHPFLVASLLLGFAAAIALVARSAVRRSGRRQAAFAGRRGLAGPHAPPGRRGHPPWLWPSVVWLAGLALFGVLRAATPAWWPPLGAA